MQVTRELRVQLMAVFCVFAFGLLIATAADLNEPRPAREDIIIDNNGVPHRIPIPAREGGLSVADVGGWVIVLASLSGVGVLLNHELLEQELAGQEVIEE